MVERERYSRLILALAVVSVLAACGGGFYTNDQTDTPDQALTNPDHTNPDHCRPLVEEHRAAPTTFETDGPEPDRIPIPFGLEGGPWVVDLVVDEHGKAVPESVEVTGKGPGTSRLALREDAIRSLFRPARLDGCWVPARFSYRVEGSR